MITKVKVLSCAVFILGVGWPVLGATGQPVESVESEGPHAPGSPTSPATGGTPLFESVDENLDPISMADMIDGKPLVLAVSSCT